MIGILGLGMSGCAWGSVGVQALLDTIVACGLGSNLRTIEDIQNIWTIDPTWSETPDPALGCAPVPGLAFSAGFCHHRGALFHGVSRAVNGGRTRRRR